LVGAIRSDTLLTIERRACLSFTFDVSSHKPDGRKGRVEDQATLGDVESQGSGSTAVLDLIGDNSHGHRLA